MQQVQRALRPSAGGHAPTIGPLPSAPICVHLRILYVTACCVPPLQKCDHILHCAAIEQIDTLRRHICTMRRKHHLFTRKKGIIGRCRFFLHTHRYLRHRHAPLFNASASASVSTIAPRAPFSNSAPAFIFSNSALADHPLVSSVNATCKLTTSEVSEQCVQLDKTHAEFFRPFR